jgi:cell division septal protein FtsQ
VTDRWQAGEAPAEEEEVTRGRGWFWLALLGLTAVCAVAVYRSALFRLEQVEVTGLKNVAEARVLDASGLYVGAPRWEHPGSLVEQRLLQEPWITLAQHAHSFVGPSPCSARRRPDGALAIDGV